MIYFINCSFSNCVNTYNNPSALQVIFNNCNALPSLTGNFTTVGLNINSSNVSQVDAYNVNLTNINGSPYVAGGGGSSITINNQADNRLITCTTTNNTLDGEANLTWDGSKLGISGVSNYVIGGGSAAGSGTVSIGNPVVGNSSVGVGASSFIGGASVCIGSSSGKSGISGTYNSIVGYWAGRGLTSGSANLIAGSNAGQALSAGNNNSFIGISSGDGQTTQSNNTIVGYYSNASDGTSHYSNCSVLGANIRNGIISGANQVQLGDSSTSVYCYGAVQNRSDSRDKNDIRDTTLGLEFIEQLRPVDFKWDRREDYVESIVNPETQELTEIQLPKDGSKKRNRYHHGLIAQEVKIAMDRMGVDFGGFQSHTVNGGSDRLTLGYEEFIAPMIKAIQELNEKVKNLELQIK